MMPHKSFSPMRHSRQVDVDVGLLCGPKENTETPRQWPNISLTTDPNTLYFCINNSLQNNHIQLIIKSAPSWPYWDGTNTPSHQMMCQCCFNAGPASQTLAMRSNIIEIECCLCWDSITTDMAGPGGSFDRIVARNSVLPSVAILP